MGFKVYAQRGETEAYVNEYVIDDENDDFPSQKDCAPGSTVICPKTSQVWMMDSEGNWIEM